MWAKAGGDAGRRAGRPAVNNAGILRDKMIFSMGGQEWDDIRVGEAIVLDHGVLLERGVPLQEVPA